MIKKNNFNYKKLFNKKVLLYCSEFWTKTLEYTFLETNRIKKTNITVYKDINHYEKIDYIIFDAAQSLNEKEPLKYFEKLNEVLEISYQKEAHLIMISSSEIYGEIKKGVKFSEYERNRIDIKNSLRAEVLQFSESLCKAKSEENGMKYTILRISEIICDETPDKNIFNLIKAIKQDGDAFLRTNVPETSYIYISDVLTGLFFVLVYGKDNSVYNICGDEDATDLELYSMIKKYFPNSNIKVQEDFDAKVARRNAIKNTKLKSLGWSPEITISDAFVISCSAYEKKEDVFMFDDAYDGKLQTIQKLLLLHILEIDRVCKKHNIKYFLGGGTLLGAVRHKGFIPWDDDADIMMLREDYDKFLSVVQNEIGSNLFLQTPKTDQLNHCAFTKIRLDNTIFATKFTSKFMKMHNGVFIDILAQDKTSNTKFISKIHVFFTKVFKSIVFHKWERTKIESDNKIVFIIANILRAVLPIKLAEKIQNKTLTLYKKKKKIPMAI